MTDEPKKEPSKWNSEVVLKPVEEIARELENEGWRILWKSEVEAIAIRGGLSGSQDIDIIELLKSLGVKLKKQGRQYLGLCPFHDDHHPSLSVNHEKGLWHCFGCGKGGDTTSFLDQAQRGTGNP